MPEREAVSLYPKGRQKKSGISGIHKFELYLQRKNGIGGFFMSSNAKAVSPTARRAAIRDMVLLALFVAILLLMTFTPIGLIDLPLIKATILHVPVIIGAILMGPKKGAFLGAVFGIASLVKNTLVPSALSFAFSPFIAVPGTDSGSFWAVVISIIPRMLIGPAAWLVYKGIEKLAGSKIGFRTVGAVIAGAFGAVVNTTLVMGLIYIVFKDAYAAMKNIPVDAVLAVILGIVGTNGVPEAIAAAVLVPVIVLPLQKFLKQY